ncbi:MAG: DUF2971 domain-containing protein [Planctomycetota bacterium]|jgi:hypothetical protein
MPEVSEEYRTLYHYTTWEGVLGIRQTQTLWATHGRFSNDETEIILFKDELINSLVPIAKKKEFRPLFEQREDARDFVTKYVDTLYTSTDYEVYITSFCGEDENSYSKNNGLLSQWRGYGTGGGIALVFNTQKMEEIMQKEGERYEYIFAFIADVIYSDDKNNIELSSYKTDIAADFEERLNSMKRGMQDAPDAGFKDAVESFLKGIGRYKHHGFNEENEVRIVCLPMIHNEENLRLAKKGGSTLKPEKERKFRTKNGKLIPYIELFNSTDIELPIEKIIVGPHKEKNERASDLRVMLRNKNIEITVSDIPYVD